MSDRHERFMAKNLAMGRAWEGDARAKAQAKAERTPVEPKMALCEKCKKEKMCLPYRSRQTDRTEGAASFGMVSKMLCADCKPRGKQEEPAASLDPKQVKHLLKDAKKFLRWTANRAC